MMNFIVTKGHTYKPHLNLNAQKEEITLDLKPKTWEFLQSALFDVVNGENGTGKNVRIDHGGTVIGKTGTSQNPHGDHHSSFVGEIEANNHKKMTLYVIIENGGKGSGAASHIAREIFSAFAAQQGELSSID